MILIDQQSEAKLSDAIEMLRADHKSARCLHIAAASDKNALFNSATNHCKILLAAECQLYLCEDGDLFILAPTLPPRDARELAERIAADTGRSLSESWYTLYELPLHSHKLLMMAERKLAVLQQAAEERRRKLAEQSLEQRREQILKGLLSISSEDIHKRRASRKQPELMMIEDDPFIRRLVENVIQKELPITGLGDATRAIDTYARLAPDILFLDINLPDVTGHELLDKILTLDPEAYVVMLSGNADRDNITQAMKRGAKGFIAKPFTRDKIHQYIERCPTLQP
ncbi:MAG: response regulator [Alphaproteobacteria bacterium]|nr:response regulator [Alphaproteobacteria bacterium]